MPLGKALLEQVFEVFAVKNVKIQTFTRLYRETGDVARMAYENCSDDTKIQMVDIITADDNRTKNHLSPRTTVMLLDELARINELKLLAKTYHVQTGTAEKGFKQCKASTRTKIQELGLHK